MTDELKPVRCGCGGEAKVWGLTNNQWYVECRKCPVGQMFAYPSEAEAVTAWNRAMSERTVKAELNPLAEDIVIGNTTFKIGTRVIAECECGTWLRLGYKYCPNCGARLEWDE